MTNAIRILGAVMLFTLSLAGCLSPPPGTEVGETQQALCPPDYEGTCPPCSEWIGCRCVPFSCPIGQKCDPKVNDCVPSGTCPSGWGNCDGSSTNGCETPLNTIANCGACGKSCTTVANGAAACVNGKCMYACNDNDAPVCM
jgi:hypothetical protein